MSRLVSKMAKAATLVILIFFALNYSWTHAALAVAVQNTDCPSDLRNAAYSRVAQLFGETQATPIMACVNSKTLGLDISHGTTRFAPLLPALIVLGPDGQTPDVAAHELAHAELAARTSVLLRSYRVPTWFDEGLAMQLDHRADYSRASLRSYLADPALRTLSLDALKAPKTFFHPGLQGKAHYAFAKCVVAAWLRETSQPQMLHRISEIGWTAPLTARAFRMGETACLQP